MNDKNKLQSIRIITKDNIPEGTRLESLKEAEGLILGKTEDGSSAICLDPASDQNLNILALGQAGKGKTTKLVIPNVLSAIQSGRSVIVTDPKHEIARATSFAAAKKGYKIKTFDPFDAAVSDKWNPLHALEHMENNTAIKAASVLARTIIKNTNAAGAKEEYFAQAEMNLLTALILYVSKSGNYKGVRALPVLNNILHALICKSLSDVVVPEKDEPAYIFWKIFLSENVDKKQLITGLILRLEFLDNRDIKQVMSETNIDLSEPGKGKCIYYVQPQSNTLGSECLSALFLSCLAETLLIDMQNDLDCRLKNPVLLILDEITSAGKITDLADIMHEASCGGLSVIIPVNSVDALKEIYGTEAYLAADECDTWLIYGTDEMNTAKVAAERTGKATTILKPEVEGAEPKKIERPVSTPDELIRLLYLNPGTAILIRKGSLPMLITTYFWKEHGGAE